MGNCQNKSSTAVVTAPTIPPPDDEDAVQQLSRSDPNGTKSSRQNMAWHRANMSIDEVYDILELIGQGSMGEVLIVAKKQTALESHASFANLTSLAPIVEDGASDSSQRSETTNTPNTDSRRKYACKTVSTVRMDKHEIEEFKNEIDILRDLDHPNIIQLFEIYSTKRKIWIVTELCTGGDLGEYAREHDMSEIEIADVMEQILRAVTYMHQRNICHRDLKFENIMFMDKSPNSPIKLIDFGLSNKFVKGVKMQKACGTIYTAAPEILLKHGYTEKTDIWSVGVLAFILLSNEYPFLRDMEEFEDEVKREKLENAQYTFGVVWKQKNISAAAKEFVASCLRRHPGARWSAISALGHVQNTWIPLVEEEEEKKVVTPTNADAENQHFAKSANHEIVVTPASHQRRKRSRMQTAMLRGMTTFAAYGEFKKRVLMTMAYTMDKTSISELRDVFLTLDVNNTGTLTLAQLKHALDKMHADKHLDEKTIEKLFKGIDLDDSGDVHYNEFIAAVLESQGMITQERLADAFDRLDSDGKGYISKDDLKNILGVEYNDKLVNKMIEEADYKKNSQIDYEEFLRLMFKNDS